jgi:DUF2971 family protein
MPYEIASLLQHAPENEAWFATMEALPPLRRRITLQRMRANDKTTVPRLLYRFQSLRRPVIRKADEPVFLEDSIERLRVVVVHSLLALRSPTEFNDPFDMCARLQIGGTDHDKRVRYRGLFDIFSETKNLGDREAWVEQMLQQPNEEILLKIQNSHNDIVARFGVICFVADDKVERANPPLDGPAQEYPARDVLMWSHYGAEHSGLCLQFDPSLDVRVFTHAVAVDYCDEYPKIDWIVDFAEGIKKSLHRKHRRWRYEHENRISIPYSAGEYLPFNAGALRGIIFGCRADADVYAAVQGLLAERAAAGLPAVRLYRATQKQDRYELNIARAKLPT